MAHNRATVFSMGTKVSILALPTIGNIIFVSLLFVLIFNSGQGLLADGDTGYHIRTGEIILKEWRVPTLDPYSFHSPPLEWTAHEWLSEIIMAVIFQQSGLTGVVLFFASLLALTHWLLYRSLRARSNDLLMCAIITLLATATSSTHWLARPHAFSLLFTLIWCFCLDRLQSRNDVRLLWVLPLLMLFWVNLHGGFIIGLVLLVIYLVGNLLSMIKSSPSQREQYSRIIRSLVIVGSLTLLACLVNPHGASILWFPLRVTSDRFVMDRVTEFLSPNFHEVLPFKYMLLAMIGVFAMSRSALNIIEATLVVLLSYMALYSARHISLFAIIIAPILLKTTEGLLTRLPDQLFEFYQNRTKNMAIIDQKLKGYLWPGLALVLVGALALGGSVRFAFDSTKFPVAAVEFLKNESISGHMFNNDEFGDYLIFAAWPAYHVFTDGRSDMYGAKYGSSYFKIAHAQPGWQAELEKYNITWVLFDTYSPLTAALQTQRDWQPIYTDKVATIFVKKIQEHAHLVSKYAAVTLPSI